MGSEAWSRARRRAAWLPPWPPRCAWAGTGTRSGQTGTCGRRTGPRASGSAASAVPPGLRPPGSTWQRGACPRPCGTWCPGTWSAECRGSGCRGSRLGACARTAASWRSRRRCPVRPCGRSGSGCRFWCRYPDACRETPGQCQGAPCAACTWRPDCGAPWSARYGCGRRCQENAIRRSGPNRAAGHGWCRRMHYSWCGAAGGAGTGLNRPVSHRTGNRAVPDRASRRNGTYRSPGCRMYRSAGTGRRASAYRCHPDGSPRQRGAGRTGQQKANRPGRLYHRDGGTGRPRNRAAGMLRGTGTGRRTAGHRNGAVRSGAPWSGAPWYRAVRAGAGRAP